MTKKVSQSIAVMCRATKLHPIVREINLLQKSRLKSLSFEKVAAYQDDIKNIYDLTLLEILSAECDSMEKI